MAELEEAVESDWGTPESVAVVVPVSVPAAESVVEHVDTVTVEAFASNVRGFDRAIVQAFISVDRMINGVRKLSVADWQDGFDRFIRAAR